MKAWPKALMLLLATAPAVAHAQGAEHVPGAALGGAAVLTEIRMTTTVLQILAEVMRPQPARAARAPSPEAVHGGALLELDRRVWAGEEGLDAALFER